jgi:ATP-dependent protease ClpP protease subunit
MNFKYPKYKLLSNSVSKTVDKHTDKNINKKAEEDDEDEEEDKKIYRENNHIYFYSEIDRNSISKLNTLIRQTEEYCIVTALRLRLDEIPIYLHIYSNGGYVHSAFAAIDVIKGCRVPVYSIIEGATASAGTLISVVCKKRFIRPTAYMLIHQLSSECWGKMSEITDEYKNLTNMMSKITNIYGEYSKLTPKKLEKLLKHDLWLDSNKSIKYGLADELYF